MKEKKERNITRILSHSEKETEAAGMLLAGLLKKGDFVALYGDLGAGKTAFVRGIAAVVTPENMTKSGWEKKIHIKNF